MALRRARRATAAIAAEEPQIPAWRHPLSHLDEWNCPAKRAWEKRAEDNSRLGWEVH
jgi:hypothetical protein